MRYTLIQSLRSSEWTYHEIHTNLKSRIIFVNLSWDTHQSEVSDHLCELVMRYTPIWSLGSSAWTYHEIHTNWSLGSSLWTCHEIHTNLKSRIIFVNLSRDSHQSEVSDHLCELIMRFTPISRACDSIQFIHILICFHWHMVRMAPAVYYYYYYYLKSRIIFVNLSWDTHQCNQSKVLDSRILRN